MTHHSNLKICLIAGEVSGDALGATLMQDIKARYNDTCFIGVGGSAMAAEGLESLFPMQDLSVMGIVEVLPRLPLILKRIRQTVNLIENEAPDLVITIDSPDFSFRVAKSVHKRCKTRPKMVHYVAPTVWAWRPERAGKVAALYDGVLCLLPMEPPYFEKEGMKALFVGHPAVAKYAKEKHNADIRTLLNITADDKIIGFLPGSRMGEINRTGSILRDALAEALTGENSQHVHVLAFTLPHLKENISALLRDFPARVHIVDDPALKWPCFSAMDMAVATSGTVGLELGIAGVPHIIGYKMNALTAYIVKSKVTTKYAHLVNILLQERAVPEFIQDDCDVALLSKAMKALPAQAETQRDAFDRVRAMLTSEALPLQAGDFIFNEMLEC